jgi:hypothetical protein
LENGSYKNGKVDFVKLEVTKFTPHLYDGLISTFYGCGANLLSLITGVDPSIICKLNKSKNHWPDAFIVDFLESRGYKLIPVTKAVVTNRDFLTLDEPIRPNHILITTQMFLKGEASWCCYYQNYCYHNFIISRLKPFDFVNMPILKAWVLWHKKYK